MCRRHEIPFEAQKLIYIALGGGRGLGEEGSIRIGYIVGVFIIYIQIFGLGTGEGEGRIRVCRLWWIARAHLNLGLSDILRKRSSHGKVL